MPTPELVKALRERTGAGIVDCMQALKATHDDLEAAIAWLQARGTIKAAKKSGAVAAEGIVNIVANTHKVVMFELNSQTDFVATNDQFKALVQKIGAALLKHDFTTVAEANAIKVDGKTIQDWCTEATATIGEKIVLRRTLVVHPQPGEVVGYYVHNNFRVASIFVARGANREAARNVAMHIASMNPPHLHEGEVPPEKLAAVHAEISASEQVKNKPPHIREHITKGMLRKHLSEITLVDQEFVMEKMPVSEYLTSQKLVPVAMYRYAVGEGVDKVVTNFAEEVRAQMKDSQS